MNKNNYLHQHIYFNLCTIKKKNNDTTIEKKKGEREKKSF
jgi:hypothetical protein